MISLCLDDVAAHDYGDPVYCTADIILVLDFHLQFQNPLLM